MHGFGRSKSTRTASAALLVAGVFGGACASSSHSSKDGDKAVGPLCADCTVETAGGQTTDFGSGGGCQGGVATPVDVDTAREQGFTLLDQLDQSFDAPFVWTPLETTGQPATGYDTHTSVHVEMTLLGVERITPAHETCGEYLRADVGVTLATADQATSIGGVLYGTEGTQGLGGTLPLNAALGTLVLRPDPWPEPLAGGLLVSMVLGPRGPRGSLRLSLVEANYQPTGGDFDGGPAYSYVPLEGKFPDDPCDITMLPYAAAEPGAAPNGASASDVVASIAEMYGPDPLRGAWSDTGDVTVTTSLGMPTEICVRSDTVAMKVPLHVTSSDGRARVDELATCSASYDADGNLTNAWLESTHDDPVARDAFPAAAGISGVNFGDVPEASWHIELYAVSIDRPQTGPYGSIVVEGVDPNVSPSSMPHELATLHWWK